ISCKISRPGLIRNRHGTPKKHVPGVVAAVRIGRRIYARADVVAILRTGTSASGSGEPLSRKRQKNSELGEDVILVPLSVSVLLSVAGLAQIPAKDARNGELPSGRMHFQMPTYKTRAEWESRAAQLRRQILSSAGLMPLPERNPLHPQIFGRLER